MMPRPVFAAFVLALPAAAQGCAASVPAAARATNLIVISVDTLRADHMSLHGYPRDTTPQLNEFARGAVTFDRAIAPWPKTVPSMVSMFTGLYPHRTGYMFASSGQYIDDTEVLLQEIAKTNGFSTSGIVSNAVLGSSSNFNQGFDRYIETYEAPVPLPDHERSTAKAVTLHSRLELRRLAAAVAPFFLWVHYVDPHASYVPPDEYAAPYHRDQHYDRTLLRLNDEGNYHAGIAPRYWRRNGGQREWGWYIAQYDGEVAYADAQIGILLDEIKSLGLLEDTAIILTADHGESLGEHNFFFEHGWFPYNASGWIPWVLYWPGIEQAGKRIAYPTSLVNLLPTIIDLMGWNPGSLEMHGRSVVPAIEGREPYAARYVVQGGGEGGLRAEEFLRTIQDDRFKLVYVPSERYRRIMQGTELELYDVIEDPMETNNLADVRPEIIARLWPALTALIDRTGPVALSPRHESDYSPAEIENLRALGYIQ